MGMHMNQKKVMSILKEASSTVLASSLKSRTSLKLQLLMLMIKKKVKTTLIVLKQFLTPAPNKYEADVPDEKPSFAFGVKHSPYLYNGRDLGRERWVSAKTEMVNGTTNGTNGGEFRQRSGTFTRDKPTVLSSAA